MSCSAVFCSSRTTKGGRKDQELSFHTFPRCPEIRRQWVKAIRRDNWEPTKYSRLCSKHFEKSCFVDGLLIKKLNTDAVPTIFKGYPAYYLSVPKKRKSQQRQDKIQMVSPRKLKKMQENDVNTEDIPITPERAVTILTTLTKTRMVAARRLQVVKKLREQVRRLAKKNATLLNVIKYLKSKDNGIRVIRFVV